MVLWQEGELMYYVNVHLFMCIILAHMCIIQTHIDMHTALAYMSIGLAAWVRGAMARG